MALRDGFRGSPAGLVLGINDLSTKRASLWQDSRPLEPQKTNACWGTAAPNPVQTAILKGKACQPIGLTGFIWLREEDLNL